MEKQIKTIQDQGREQINPILNQKERKASLINNDNSLSLKEKERKKIIILLKKDLKKYKN